MLVCGEDRSKMSLEGIRVYKQSRCKSWNTISNRSFPARRIRPAHFPGIILCCWAGSDPQKCQYNLCYSISTNNTRPITTKRWTLFLLKKCTSTWPHQFRFKSPHIPTSLKILLHYTATNTPISKSVTEYRRVCFYCIVLCNGAEMQ